MKWLRTVIATACMVTAGISPAFAADTSGVMAYWEPQQFKFRYLSLSTFYTCHGLQGKLKKLLVAIGAREDARVEVKCYGTHNSPQQYNVALLAFSIPVIADIGSDATDIFPATWEEIRVDGSNPRDLAGGDCELVDAFHEQVVQQLNIAVLEERVRCLSRNQRITPPVMKLRMLQPVESADEAAGQTVTGGSAGE